MTGALAVVLMAGCGGGDGASGGGDASISAEPEAKPVVDLTGVTIANPGGSVSAPTYMKLDELFDYTDMSGGTVELPDCPLMSEEQLRGDLSFSPPGVMKATLEPYNQVDDSDTPSLLCALAEEGSAGVVQLWISGETHPVERAMGDMNFESYHWLAPTPFMSGDATMYCYDDNGLDKCEALATLDGVTLVGRLAIRGVDRQELADWFSDAVLAAVALA